MGLFDKLFGSDSVKHLSEEEQEDLKRYVNDRDGWNNDSRRRIQASRIRPDTIKKINEDTADYYATNDPDTTDSDTGSDYIPTDYSAYQDGL